VNTVSDFGIQNYFIMPKHVVGYYVK